MKFLILIVYVLVGPFQASSQQRQESLRGSVLDSNGLPVIEAKVEVSNSSETNSCKTNEQGKFLCLIKTGESFTVTIQADGFSILLRKFPNTQDLDREITFTLLPRLIRGDVLVTTGRTETLLSETASSVAKLSKEALDNTASPTIDDALRQTVGFSLFRRSNSRNANPTTQGTSLRGINASGASRSLVLFDGIPLNDGFGGWIVWSRVPKIAIDRIEVLRGGASSLYGSSSLGGTINVIPKRTTTAEKFTFSAEFFGGTQNTFSGSTFFGFTLNDWTADLSLSIFQTKGYKIVDEAERGLADDFANSHNSNFSGRFARNLSSNANIFIKASSFGEGRNNGTPIQKNRTHFRQVAIGADFDVGDLGSSFSNSNLNLRAYGGTQVFDQNFSAVAANRNSEFLVRLQRVPSQNFGASGQFTTIFNNQAFLAGFETKEVRGASNELGFFGGRLSSRLGSGGRERTYGAYFQDLARVGENLVLAASIRFDSWKNSRALRSQLTISTNQTTITEFPDRTQNALSPSGSVLFHATDKISFYINASRSFRAPTLNELYRGFRVGSVITDPNENLVAEKANNFETGASYSNQKFYVRGNFYWTEVSDAVANVTVNTTPTLVFRQRQNAGKTRVRGLEIEAEAKLNDFGFTLGYLLADAKFVDFPSNPSIEGLRLPQVPKHQFTFQTQYTNKRGWTIALQGRASSAQFDDDLNTQSLERYVQTDIFFAKRFKKDLQIFLAIENIFNSRYSIGRTPVRTVSSPTNFRIGLRWK